MSSAFKLEPTGATTGEFGTSSYGTETYGGSDQIDAYVIPDPEEGSDDLERAFNWMVGENVHRRSGVVVGARKYAERRRWQIVYHQIPQADVDQLLGFFRARKFRFIPDATDEASYYTVRWVETEFTARQRRGGPYRLQFTIEEVS